MQAEKIVGRVLYNNECVHHKDFNKLNNNVDNLMIFASKADHTSFHSGNNDIYCIDNIWYTNKKCIIRNNDHNCPICGNLKYYRATMCQKCEYKSRESKIRPSKEILEKWILFYPMTYIGKMFGVSDKCIVKWCKYYGIPFYYNDIQEYRSKNPINIITPIYFE